VYSSNISPANPKCYSISFAGDFVEEQTITAIPRCLGVFKNQGVYVFHRLQAEFNGPFPRLSIENNEPVLIQEERNPRLGLVTDDVNHFIQVTYTPENAEGETGEPFTVVSPVVVAPCVPYVSSVTVEGEPMEGKELKGVGIFKGSVEGKSRCVGELYDKCVLVD
jgi:hypothetical protein